MPVIKHDRIRTRDELAIHAGNIWRHEIAVEVGVHRGDYAKKILAAWHGRLVLVDSYREVGPDYPESQLDGERKEHLWEVANGIGRDERCMVIVADSEKSSGLFDNESLAFVYIDADHTYEAVKRDIELWWPKVRLHDGILAGHDYESYHSGVKRAVDEFAANRAVYVTGEEDCPPSWFCFK